MSFLQTLLGRPLVTFEDKEHKIGRWTSVSPLGPDVFGSASNGPEAASSILLPVGAAGLASSGPLSLVILVLLAILYFSYWQTTGLLGATRTRPATAAPARDGGGWKHANGSHGV